MYIASRCALYQCEMQRNTLIIFSTLFTVSILSLAITFFPFLILYLQAAKLKSISIVGINIKGIAANL